MKKMFRREAVGYRRLSREHWNQMYLTTEGGINLVNLRAPEYLIEHPELYVLGSEYVVPMGTSCPVLVAQNNVYCALCVS